MSRCVPFLRAVCTNSTLRVAKTVRAQMLSMEPLLAADRDFRVIHLLRDPRGVVSSRREMNDESVIGRYALNGRAVNASASVHREAAVYCRTAVLDIRVRQALEAKFPGRFLTLNYEDIVADLRRHADLVYHFLGMETPTTTKQWIAQNAAKMKAKAKKPGYISSVEKWRKHLKPADSKAIVDDICRDYFRLVQTRSTFSLKSPTVHPSADARRTVNSLHLI